MTMEEILAVVQKIKDAWVAFGQSMAEAAQALEDMFRNLGESDELWPKRNGIPPKKYGMSLHRRVQLLLATSLSPWHLELGLTSGVHFEEQT